MKLLGYKEGFGFLNEIIIQRAQEHLGGVRDGN